MKVPRFLRRPELRRLARDERGATAVEYGLIASLIVVGWIAALTQMADSNTNKWSSISSKVDSAMSGNE